MKDHGLRKVLIQMKIVEDAGGGYVGANHDHRQMPKKIEHLERVVNGLMACLDLEISYDNSPMVMIKKINTEIIKEG